MNPNFHDPNNHVPKVTPGDDWGDDADAAERLVLPPKKQPTAPPARKKSLFDDPNNHVPPASDTDEWGGEEEGSLLPRKRKADEKPAGAHAPAPPDDSKGIEIGVRVIDKPESEPGAKPPGVQRLEVQEHVPKLLAPEVAPLPKIVPKQVIERPEGEAPPVYGDRFRPTAESEMWGTAKPVAKRWIVMSVAAMGVFLVGGALLVRHIGWEREKSTRLNYSRLEVYDAGPNLNETDDEALTEGIEDKAKQVIEAYAMATQVDEVLPLVRDRERVEPLLKAHWNPMEIKPGWKIPDNSEWSIRKAGKRDYGFITGLLPSLRPFRFYIVQKGETALLDWEASTGYCETPFPGLVKGEGLGGTTRCLVSPGDLYTFSVPEVDYQCFRLGSPDGESTVWGYVRRDSPVFEELTGLFMQGAIPREIFSEYAVTLKLDKAPEDSLPNQWIIAEMLHIEWIKP